MPQKEAPLRTHLTGASEGGLLDLYLLLPFTDQAQSDRDRPLGPLYPRNP